MAHHAPRLAEIPGVFVFGSPNAAHALGGVVLPALSAARGLDALRSAYVSVRARTLAPVAIDAEPGQSYAAWELGLALMPELAVVPTCDDTTELTARGALAMQYGVVPLWEAASSAEVERALAASHALKRRARLLCRTDIALATGLLDQRAILVVCPERIDSARLIGRQTFGLWQRPGQELPPWVGERAMLEPDATRAVLGCSEVREPCG